MGKPIAGRGQLPFAQGGMLVNAAVIDGNIFVKNLYVYKQRSDLIFDLIDDNGDIYYYKTLTHTDYNDEPLDYFEIDDTQVQRLKNNTFYIKEQDYNRGIFGFAFMYHVNKIKVHTGEYIFFNEGSDKSTSGYYNDPKYIEMNVGDYTSIRSIPISPHKFNPTGKWKINGDLSLLEISHSYNNFVSVKANAAGRIVVSFTPDDNPTITSQTEIVINDAPREIESFDAVVVINDFNKPKIIFGDDFEIRAIVEPLNYKLERPINFFYDNNVITPISVSEDFLTYKFKMVGEPSVKRQKVYNMLAFFSDTNGKSYSRNIQVDSYQVQDIYDGYTPFITGKRYLKVGVPYTYGLQFFTGVRQPETGVFYTNNPAIATATPGGEVTAHKEGSFNVIYKINDQLLTELTVFAANEYPEEEIISPALRNAYMPGDEIHFSKSFIPSSPDDDKNSRWDSKYAPKDSYFSNDGVLKIPSSPDEKGYIDSKTIYGYYIKAEHNGGYYPTNTTPYYTGLPKWFYICGKSYEPENIEFVTPTQFYQPVGTVYGHIFKTVPEHADYHSVSYEIDDTTIAEVKDEMFSDTAYEGKRQFMIYAHKSGITNLTITVSGPYGDLVTKKRIVIY